MIILSDHTSSYVFPNTFFIISFLYIHLKQTFSFTCARISKNHDNATRSKYICCRPRDVTSAVGFSELFVPTRRRRAVSRDVSPRRVWEASVVHRGFTASARGRRLFWCETYAKTEPPSFLKNTNCRILFQDLSVRLHLTPTASETFIVTSSRLRSDKRPAAKKWHVSVVKITSRPQEGDEYRFCTRGDKHTTLCWISCECIFLSLCVTAVHRHSDPSDVVVLLHILHWPEESWFIFALPSHSMGS